MTPSKYQQNFYEAVEKSRENLLLVACAGGGKTTALQQAAKYLPTDQKNLALSFSKEIVKELSERLPYHVPASTMHSLGMKIIRQNRGGKISVSQYKSIYHSNDMDLGTFGTQKDKFLYQIRMRDIINYAKLTLTEPSEEAFKAIANTYGILIKKDEKNLIKHSVDLYHKLESYNSSYGQKTFYIDYTDMLYIPIKLGYKIPIYANVLIDEAQDLNNLQHLILEKLLGRRGRLIAVGDEYQSIYGFAGANTDSIELLETKFRCKRMPLSISYRCGRNIVEHAQKINPTIEPFAQAKDGIVRVGYPKEIDVNDLVLCRNKLPLFEMYDRLIESEIPARVVGEGNGDEYVKVIEAYEDSGLNWQQIIEELEGTLEDVIAQLVADGVENPKNHYKYQKHLEVVRIISHFLKRYQDSVEAIKALRYVFTAKEGVRLMTAHKSKGLENDRVFVIKTFAGKKLLPSTWATSPEQLKQERNLDYVIRTRAKSELIYIDL